jgi:hypothetical protein
MFGAERFGVLDAHRTPAGFNDCGVDVRRGDVGPVPGHAHDRADEMSRTRFLGVDPAARVANRGAGGAGDRPSEETRRRLQLSSPPTGTSSNVARPPAGPADASAPGTVAFGPPGRPNRTPGR